MTAQSSTRLATEPSRNRTAADRRTWARHRHARTGLRAWVRQLGGPDTVVETPAIMSQRVQVVDLSAGGIGLLLPDGLEPGALLTVALEKSGQQYSRRLLVRVMHRVADSRGGWRVG